MTVIVTGASGFVGAAVMAQLRHQGHHVVGVSRRAAEGCIRVDDYADAPAGEVLVHLAQDNLRSRVNAAGEDAVHDAQATLRTLMRQGRRRVVYASSAALYGDADLHPHRPDDPPRADDTYSRLKLACEQEVLSGPPTEGVVARLANVYGNGMSRENVVSRVLEQAGAPGPVQVADETPVRDFIWIADVACALVAMALGTGGGIYNVGTGSGTSIRQLAETMLHLRGQASRDVVSTGSGHRTSCLVVDPTTTRQTFGWEPKTPLSEGLALLLARR